MSDIIIMDVDAATAVAKKRDAESGNSKKNPSREKTHQGSVRVKERSEGSSR